MQGTVRRFWCIWGIKWDHPCACREQSPDEGKPSGLLGSSLRMQGTVTKDGEDAVGIGIIPAYAGNSCSVVFQLFQSQDHPCVCREQYYTQHVIDLILGSSLRMQGTVIDNADPVNSDRIIPAYAGNRR